MSRHSLKKMAKNFNADDITPEELKSIEQGLREVAEGKTKSFDEIESELATKYNRLN